MIINYDKNHRIKCGKDYDRSVPQWRGMFLWHDFTVITPEISGGEAVHYAKVTGHAAFRTANDACMFLRIALKQEFNGRSRGTVSDEEPNFPELAE